MEILSRFVNMKNQEMKLKKMALFYCKKGLGGTYQHLGWFLYEEKQFLQVRNSYSYSGCINWTWLLLLLCKRDSESRKKEKGGYSDSSRQAAAKNRTLKIKLRRGMKKINTSPASGEL